MYFSIGQWKGLHPSGLQPQTTHDHVTSGAPPGLTQLSNWLNCRFPTWLRNTDMLMSFLTMFKMYFFFWGWLPVSTPSTPNRTYRVEFYVERCKSDWIPIVGCSTVHQVLDLRPCSGFGTVHHVILSSIRSYEWRQWVHPRVPFPGKCYL